MAARSPHLPPSAFEGGFLSPAEPPPRTASEPSTSRSKAGARRTPKDYEPWSSPEEARPRRGRWERSRSPRRDDEDDEELGLSLPGVSTVNLQRQRPCSVLEIRADGSQTIMAMRMREVMQRIQEVVAVPAAVAAKAKPRSRSRTDKAARRAHNALHPRDLRSIDNSHPRNCKNPAIVVRQHVIVANFDPLRVVVVHDRMLVLLPHDDDDLSDELCHQLTTQTTLGSSGASEDALQALAKDDASGAESGASRDPSPGSLPKTTSNASLTELEEDTAAEAQPFELRALEAVLDVCTRRLDDACDRLDGPAAQSMEKMSKSSRMTLKHLERLRHIKNEVSNLEARARDTAEAIEATLDEDEDMCMMRLSLLRERPTIFDPPISAELLTQHEDVELLLESYLQDAEAVQTRLELLRLSIDNAEDLFTMKLDIARNRLITADTIFTLLGMVAASGALVAGLFGMNLAQEKPSFLLVSVATGVVCVVATAAIVVYLLRSKTLVF